MTEKDNEVLHRRNLNSFTTALQQHITPYGGIEEMTGIPWDSIVQGGISLLNGGLNYGLQMMTNQKNEQLLREAWARDDSGMQRAVEDAKKAGFSPLAAMGSTLGNTNPTSMNAPQMDLSGVAEAAGQYGAKKLARDQFNLQKTQIETEMANMKETTRGLKLDNDLKEGKFQTELQKEAEELNKMMRDNEISEAAYIGSLMDLKARGLSNTYIDALLESRRGKGGDINMHADEIEKDAKTTEEILNTQANRLSTNAKRIAQQALNNVGIRWAKDVPFDKALEEYWSKENISAREAATAAEKALAEANKQASENNLRYWKQKISITVPNYREDGTFYYETITGTPQEVADRYKYQADKFVKMYTNKTYNAGGGDFGAGLKALFTPVMSLLGALE